MLDISHFCKFHRAQLLTKNQIGIVYKELYARGEI